MLKNEPTYKKLILRRDILKIIFDLRMYRELNKNCQNDYINRMPFYEYVKNHGDLLSRLDKIIEATKEGLVNLYALGEYDDDLGNEVIKLYDLSSPQEKENLLKLEDEIMYLKQCCPMLNTFTTELMIAFYELGLPEEYEKRISKILKLLPYNSLSSEREFIIRKTDNYTWFKNYLFKTSIPDVEHQKNLDEFILTFTTLSNTQRIELLKSVLPLYKKKSVKLTSNIIQALFKKENNKKLNPISSISAMNIIRESKLSIDENPHTYLKKVLENAKSENKENADIPSLLFETFNSMIKLFDYEECLIVLVKLATPSDDLYTALLNRFTKKYHSRYIKEVFEKVYNEVHSNDVNNKLHN